MWPGGLDGTGVRELPSRCRGRENTPTTGVGSWQGVGAGREATQSSAAPTEGDAVPEVPQPVTDNSVKVRQLTHYQFSWVAGEPGQPGTYTLQLVLDQGAWEEVLTLDPDDADNLQDLLTNTGTVHYDIERRVLMFGVTPTGS